jgi:uncharacterized protein YbaR (Trm112 family)
MKRFFRFIWRVTVFIGVVTAIIYVVQKLFAPTRNEMSDNGVLPAEPIQSLDDAPLGGAVSDELLRILVCPEDKGPLEVVDEGKFLLNPRNGYKYPIRSGIPVMLIEEGRKYQDKSLHTNGAGGEKRASAAEKKPSEKPSEKAD